MIEMIKEFWGFMCGRDRARFLTKGHEKALRAKIESLVAHERFFLMFNPKGFARRDLGASYEIYVTEMPVFSGSNSPKIMKRSRGLLAVVSFDDLPGKKLEVEVRFKYSGLAWIPFILFSALTVFGTISAWSTYIIDSYKNSIPKADPAILILPFLLWAIFFLALWVAVHISRKERDQLYSLIESLIAS